MSNDVKKLVHFITSIFLWFINLAVCVHFAEDFAKGLVYAVGLTFFMVLLGGLILYPE